MVPANRVGSEVMTLPQLKILQEAITLSVFVPFAILFAKQRIGWNYFFAALCIAAAVFFIFSDKKNVANAEQNPVGQATAPLTPSQERIKDSQISTVESEQHDQD